MVGVLLGEQGGVCVEPGAEIRVQGAVHRDDAPIWDADVALIALDLGFGG